MCERITIAHQADNHEDAYWGASLKLRNYVDAATVIHRTRPEREDAKACDWFLRHSDCQLSVGGTQIGGEFIFQRVGDGDRWEDED